MIVKALVSSEEAAPGRPRPEWDTQDFRDGSSGSFVVTRLVSLDGGRERGKDVIRPAMLGQKYFKACTCGLDRLNKDAFWFVMHGTHETMSTTGEDGEAPHVG